MRQGASFLVFGFCAAFACARVPAAAQTTSVPIADRIYLFIGSSTPKAPKSSQIVRWPNASYRFPSTVMPRKIAINPKEITVDIQANVMISSTGKLESCHAEPEVTQWQTQVGEQKVSDIALGAQACLLLARYATFHPALYENGEMGGAQATVTILLKHSNSPNAPMPWPGRTSGFVLDANGQKLFDNDQADKLVITPPDWDKALPDRAKMHYPTRVGVMLSLHTKDGISHVEGCKLVVPSDNAKVDSATCTALMSTGYSYPQNVNMDNIAIIVTWRANGVFMETSPKISVPHMPADVALTPSDVPAGDSPANKQVQIAVRLGVDGQVIGCTVTQSSGSDVYDAASCRIAHARAHFTIARDRFGLATLGAYDAVVDWDKMAIRPSR